MSLADELESGKYDVVSPIDDWVTEWLVTLSSEDRAAWNSYLDDPRRSPTHMFRVARNHGFPYSESGFCKWVGRQRGARDSR